MTEVSPDTLTSQLDQIADKIESDIHEAQEAGLTGASLGGIPPNPFYYQRLEAQRVLTHDANLLLGLFIEYKKIEPISVDEFIEVHKKLTEAVKADK